MLAYYPTPHFYRILYSGTLLSTDALESRSPVGCTSLPMAILRPILLGGFAHVWVQWTNECCNSLQGTPYPEPPTQQAATESHHDVGPVLAERVTLLDSTPESADMAGTVVTSGLPHFLHHASVLHRCECPYLD